MEYPHRQYLLYLVSRQMPYFQIAAECASKDLVPPNEEDYDLLARDLGPVPRCWRGTVESTNTKFIRWLRDRNLLPLWKQTHLVRKATEFLFVSEIRKDFEALIIIHGNAEEARKELLLKHQEHLVPELNVLETFCEYFWDIGAVSREGLLGFLRVNEERRELLPALKGDIVQTYSLLGLRQRVKSEAFYDNIVAYADLQVEAHRREGRLSQGGRQNAGLAAILRVGLDADESRKQLRVAAGEMEDEIGAEISRFRMKKQPRVSGFLTLDELMEEEQKEQEGVIDAEFKELRNVRKFPTSESSGS
jgi:hypothetical protein